MNITARLGFVLFCLPVAAAAQELTELQEEIVTNCQAGMSLSVDVCTCLAGAAGDQLSEPGQRMFLAMVQNDPDAVAAATQNAPMADQIAAPMLMLGGLQSCLLGGPMPDMQPPADAATATQTVPTDTGGASAEAVAAGAAEEASK